jgi:predicted ArsR family transcriptional regulator
MRRQLTGTRHEILSLLRREGPRTIQDLCACIGITPVGVRKHLDSLELEGLVSSTTVRRPVGRPARVYALTEAAEALFPQAYAAMLSAVLRHLSAMGGDDLLRQAVDAYHREIESACREARDGARPLGERVESLARAWSQAGYMAEWSREEELLVLRQHNCPLARTAREFPPLCESERALLERLLGDAAVVGRSEHLLAGHHCCAYTIRPR